MKKLTGKELVAFGVGALLGALITQQFVLPTDSETNLPHSDAYHVHADFLIYVNDKVVNLNDDKHMTTHEQEHHEHAHLHDNEGKIQHMHEPGVTFAEFLGSLGIELTNDCLTVNDETYCTDGEEVLLLFVNDEPFKGNVTTFEAMDEDRVLLYYGAYDAQVITDYLDEVGDEACIYSGTCPERGTAPPESCGLTCEL